MDGALHGKLVSLLNAGRVMRVGTLRPDGWPQTAAVGYANDGLDIYFPCTLAIDDEEPMVVQIGNLSVVARTCRMTDAADRAKAIELLSSRHPDRPPQTEAAIRRLTPMVISAPGLGHADLVHGPEITTVEVQGSRAIVLPCQAA